jgi:hypothetical protein
MRRILSAAFSACALFLLVSCSSLSSSGHLEGVTRRIDVPTVLPAEFSPDKYLLVAELSRHAQPVFFYQDHEGYTHFWTGQRDVVINREIVDKYKALGAVPLAMSYGFDGKDLYFSQPMKWDKKKQIIVKLRPDGTVLYTRELSELAQVLRPASFAFDERGQVLMSWIDETPPRLKVIYVNMSPEGVVGQELAIADETDAMLYHESLHTPKGFAVVYSRTGVLGQRDGEVRVRWLADGKEDVLYHGPDVSGFDMARASGDIVIHPYQPGEESYVLVFDRTLQLKRRYALAHPKALGRSFGVTDALSLSAAGPVLVGGGVPPEGVVLDGYPFPAKSSLYASTDGKDFTPLVGTTPHLFTSERPSVVAANRGAVIGFSDRRFVSVTPMLAVVDYTGAVVKRDVALEPPSVRTGRVSLVVLDDDTVRAFYPVHIAGQSQWIYRAQDLSLSKMRSDYTLPPTPQREAQLLTRAQEYAACRLKEDYQCIYDMLDPTYREGVDKTEHESRMKALGVKIESYKVDSCRVLLDSVLGKCQGEIAATLPPTLMGKPIAEAQRKVKQTLGGEVWVYVNGEWYYAVNLPMLGFAVQW